MVFRLGAPLQQAQGFVGVPRGFGDHCDEIGFAHMVGARAGNESPAGAKHLQCAEVQFLVAAEGGFEVFAGFGEGRL